MNKITKKQIINSSLWLRRHGGSVVGCLNVQEKRIEKLEKTERENKILIEVSRMIDKRFKQYE